MVLCACMCFGVCVGCVFIEHVCEGQRRVRFTVNAAFVNASNATHGTGWSVCVRDLVVVTVPCNRWSRTTLSVTQTQLRLSV